MRIFLLICVIIHWASGMLLDPLLRKCELETLNVATRLADQYNMYDESVEWDVRIHNDYLVEYLGFAGWIQMGVWKNTGLSATKQDCKKLHQVRTKCCRYQYICVFFYLNYPSFHKCLFSEEGGQEAAIYQTLLTGLCKISGYI
jgi:hypothetical protein